MSRRNQIVLAAVVFGVAGLFFNMDATAASKKDQRLWRAKCASCHGKDGKAQTKQGEKMGMSDMTLAAWQKEFSDEKIKETILKGFSRKKNGKKQEMKPFAKKLTPEKIDTLVKIVREFAK